MDKNYYSLNIKEVLKSLKTSEEGLTDNEAKQRSVQAQMLPGKLLIWC